MLLKFSLKNIIIVVVVYMNAKEDIIYFILYILLRLTLEVLESRGSEEDSFSDVVLWDECLSLCHFMVRNLYALEISRMLDEEPLL